MRPDPDLSAYQGMFEDNYEALNYEKGLSSYFMRRSHSFLEASVPKISDKAQVLEVGAGTGQHFSFVRHSFENYFVTDTSKALLDHARRRLEQQGKIVIEEQDAANLLYPDDSFDRLIASHVLEHMPDPHLVLREWNRVVRPGGIISILLPCDPGVLWRIGRCLGPRANANRAGMPYDYIMAREHINSITNLHALIAYYFSQRMESWYPAFVPSVDLNLFYAVHIRVKTESETQPPRMST